METFLVFGFLLVIVYGFGSHWMKIAIEPTNLGDFFVPTTQQAQIYGFWAEFLEGHAGWWKCVLN